MIASNGLWSNVPLDVLHYELRGPGSFLDAAGQSNGPVESEATKRELKHMAERISKIGKICSRKGNYESPIYLKA